jgi:hypothetical protein
LPLVPVTAAIVGVAADRILLPQAPARGADLGVITNGTPRAPSGG